MLVNPYERGFTAEAIRGPDGTHCQMNIKKACGTQTTIRQSMIWKTQIGLSETIILN